MRRELKFTFTDSDDGQFYMISNAENLYWVLYDFDQELRDIVKYPDKADKLELDVDTVDSIRTILREFMDDKGVDFDQVE